MADPPESLIIIEAKLSILQQPRVLAAAIHHDGHSHRGLQHDTQSVLQGVLGLKINRDGLSAFLDGLSGAIERSLRNPAQGPVVFIEQYRSLFRRILQHLQRFVSQTGISSAGMS